MARHPRSDSPGAWFHIMNRGVARRTLFEYGKDIRVFRNHLRAATERGEIEVHSYCFMTTHYHLLVRSPAAELGSAMQRIQTEYSRWFNRSRRRDGPLVRGRYFAKRVGNETYRRAVVGYIDRNPVSAGLVPKASEYAHGSAHEYATASEGSWLKRDWVEGKVRRILELEKYDPTRYDEVFGKLPRSLARIVEARWRFRSAEDPLDDLIAAAPARVLAWMKRKSELADGTRPGLPVLVIEDLEAALQSHRVGVDPGWRVGRRSGWAILRVGLARQLCGLALDEIGAEVELSRSAVGKLADAHKRLIQSDEFYAMRAAEVGARALRAWKVEESD